MENRSKNENSRTGLWEVLIIAFIWLVVVAMVYIIFWKAKSNLN